MTTTVQKTATKTLTLRQQLSGDYFKQQVALALPKHMTPDRFVRVALTALMKNPKLLECTPESVIQCMLNCSALGLEPDGRRAHLIPYGNVCTMIVDYKGIVELAKRSGDVSNVFAQIVCDKDNFAWENGKVKHHFFWKNDRGEMYAVYATITFKDGTEQSDVMTRAEIDAIRNRSRAGKSGPWVTDFNEMAKKTVFRRASKWITLSPEVADALDKEEQPFTSASLVNDLASAPTNEPPAVETADDVNVITSAESSDDEIPGAEIPAATKPQSAEPSLQTQLASVVNGAKFSYDDFAKWAVDSGNVPDAREKTGFEEIHDAICRRLLRSTVGMLKGIAQVKGVAA